MSIIIYGDVTDNRIENLEIMSRTEHINIHRDDLLRGKMWCKKKEV